MTVVAAIDEARVVMKRAQGIYFNYDANAPGKNLWGSCVDCFSGIVFALNMVLDQTEQPSPLDVHTWLSAGVAYINVCEKGFEMINMINTMLPSISTELTKLLLNSLAISVAIRGVNSSPLALHGWNFSDDYKLSNLTNETPNVVVAQDGSGKFRTVQEAVNSAGNRRWGQRYVIYVKSGVYDEQVLIPRGVNFITISGDGINKTIITGNKHYGGDNVGTPKAGDLKSSSTFLRASCTELLDRDVEERLLRSGTGLEEGDVRDQVSKIDAGDPLYLHPSDSSVLTIISIKLKGTENYRVWANAMKLALKVKNKYGFIDGTCTPDEDDDVLINQWDRCNSVVLTWLLNSVSEELYLGQVYSSLASDVWKELKDTYDKVDGSVDMDQILQLPVCTCEASRQFNDFTRLIKLMQFLMGLDSSYQSIRTNLLIKDELPTVKEAFAIISREESHRNTNSSKTPTQTVGFNSKLGQSFDAKKKFNKRENSSLKCTHCNKTGHSVDKCFEIIGYPTWMKPRFNSGKKPVANNCFVSDNCEENKNFTTGNLTPDQFSKLLSLLNDKSVDAGQCSHSAGMENKSFFYNSFGSHTYVFNGTQNRFHNKWIIDSGENQHMVMSDVGIINPVDVSDMNMKVKHPNGTSALVTKIGNLKLHDKVVLSDVFVVPDYCVNLMSVYKLARDSKLTVWFDENSCNIQDSHTRKVLVTGRQLDGLYFCANSPDVSNVLSTGMNELWHSRLPSSVLHGKSPYELIHGFKPSLTHLRTFGCLAFSTVLNNNDKFSTHSQKCVFLGYSNQKKGYKLLSLDNKEILFSRDVKFYEVVFPFKENLNLSDNELSTTVNTLNFFDLFDQSSNKGFFGDNTPNDDVRVDNNDGLSHGSLQPDRKSDSTEGRVEAGERNNVRVITTSSCSTSPQPDSSISSEESQQPSGVTSPVGRAVGVIESNDKENTDSRVNSEGGGLEQLGSTLRRSSRNIVFPRKLNDFVVEGKVKYSLEKVVNYSHLSQDNFCFSSSLNKSSEPKSYYEAVTDSNWVSAMNEEIEALHRNNTWELVPLPPNRKTIGCKWIYKLKYKSTGEIDRHKARLVAKGFSQREGLDFDETFSPVVKMVTVRCVLALAVKHDWNIFQLDINNAFLYGDLHEDVYMALPDGFYSKSETRVCKLKKSLYGLKQAPRMWNEKLVGVLLDLGFVQSLCDTSMFVKITSDSFVVLLVYVDDMIITGNNDKEIEKVKLFLKSKFRIKDLGLLKFFLGIEVIRDKVGLCLSQRKYCLELLAEFGLTGCKPVSCPIEQNFVITSQLDSNNTVLSNITVYQKLVGKLIYLTHTRPDISYAVHFLSQFMHKPKTVHFKVALRLLRYLKNAPGKGILLKRDDDFVIKAYADSDWAKCTVSRKSITGFCVKFGESLISWKSKKQSTVSRSTAEAEFRSMFSLFCDNTAAVAITSNPVFHEKTKHFEVDLFFLREKVHKGTVTTVSIASQNQLADVFTKEVWGRRFIALHLTFRNTVGLEGGQAVVFLSGSDQLVLYRCSIEGYQDTIFALHSRQFYKECQNFGTVDFIFGEAHTMFQDCDIFLRKPLLGGGLVVMANARKYQNESGGFSLQGCKITAADDLKPVIGEYNKAFLGRPWYPYARTVYMQSFIDGLVDPKGWLDSWGHNEIAYCGEYQNYGHGSSTDHRVKWPGYQAITDPNIAKQFTAAEFIAGNEWIPKSDVPYVPGFERL
ncbi:hypothetical protein SSX86_016073 [Deinandra increscens subsp. villosa]|uniref:Pectinesterase n=1 Tax=Deinandra increscens subsp. villosa TaxID=3103831 RepID=A0AAP0CX85_9ASTR